MSAHFDWAQIARYIDELYTASHSLERMLYGRKFKLDGHACAPITEVA